MRRIPCPQRAIDPSLPVTSLLRHQIPLPSCRRVVSPHPLLRTTSASFSTTPTFSFLNSDKPDKKRHQQFVRRWQKRLLGDSEPIGAHVDPYDPTSPVRIAPEEQGEEIEELVDDGGEGSEGSGMNLDAIYEEETVGRRLKHVGGAQWVERLEEGNLAKDYEKLTLRTYTPLNKRMVTEMEDLTGTFYTLRDDNLTLGQDFEKLTNKPYTKWSFGPASPVRDLPKIRSNFHQAVAEIYALKQAGKNLDVSAAANRGIYKPPKWVTDVKLQKTSSGEFALSFPGQRTVHNLVKSMQYMPEYSPQQQAPKKHKHKLVIEEEDVVVEEPVLQMDPDTPAFRRTAVVTQDPDKKPFDFMSNRPVPRTPPQPPADPVVEPAVETPVQVEEPVVVEKKVGIKPASPTPTAEVDTTTKKSATDPSRLTDLEKAVKASQKEIASLRATTRDVITMLASEKIVRIEIPKTEAQSEADAEAKWRHVPLTDIDIKFALTKRMNQLTGLYISDPKLTSAETLGELYHHFCAAAKPKPARLFSQIHVLGQRQAQVAKQAAQTSDPTVPTPRTKPNISTLLKLNNVEIHRTRPNAFEERKKKGLNKVIGKEIRARGLNNDYRSRYTSQTESIEGTRKVPRFGTPVSPTAATLLKERTERIKQTLFERPILDGGMGMDANKINMMMRRRKIIE
ncbi:hypothetical protein P280DRAFT_443787 [Massarina eburnea CBS 473.64]|uniref:Large ribosomal subunit protein mL50 n=1 Tax=Massarina eburnea CBS 473.64 TaxID=1395130 RepID=A0A6A6SA67_9PLEO|nr:hypothetical protein P280DRAFT_443787 [Massarina eburnea CBS 473.64]